jgi:hypothetical protein
MSGSDYLSITGSPVELIAEAEALRAKGEAFKGDMKGLLGDIDRLDAANTIGNDDFAKEFNKTYQKPMEAGGGTMLEAHEAAKQSAVAIATTASDHGAGVSTSIQGYMETEVQTAAQIANT